MKEELKIVFELKKAKTDTNVADMLIKQYLPFIKSETAKFIKKSPTDDDDELSIAMLAFYECILSFDERKGSFFSLASITIRNRLIDYYRKEQRHRGLISLESKKSDEDERSLSDKIAVEDSQVSEMPEKMATQKEIEEFSSTLKKYGLSYSDIADSCPKQDRTLEVCMAALDYVRENPKLLDKLVKTKKLPLAELTKGAGLERKTLERHRKYLVAIMLAYTNGFEIIRGHLCMIKRKEVTNI